MKKVFFYLVLCLAFSAGSFAQGIEFHKGDWASVKAKAKQENKLIFIDFYTSWCGPCKYMAKNIFPLPEVGEFYNSNFINYKVDAEKGEGVALAEKYSVKGYPTLLFVDHEGTFVHQNGGGLGVERFIELGKTALNPNERYGSIDYEKLDENTDLSEVPGRILKLKDEMMPFNDLYRKYLNTIPKKELYSKKTFDLMETVGMKRTSSYTYSFVYQNKKDFEKAVGKSAVDRFFYNVYMSETFSLINNKQPTDPIYEQMGKDGFTFSNKVKEAVDISFYAYQQRPEKFVVAARKFVKNYGKDEKKIIFRRIYVEGLKLFKSYEVARRYITDELMVNYFVDGEYAFEVNGYTAGQFMQMGENEIGLKYANKALEFKPQKESDKNEVVGIRDKMAKAIEAKKTGNYSIAAKGFDNYNGYTMVLTILSDTNIGEKVKKEVGTISNGEIVISGNSKNSLIADWHLEKDGKMAIGGQFIIQPGETNAVFNKFEEGRLIPYSYYTALIYGEIRLTGEPGRQFDRELKELISKESISLSEGQKFVDTILAREKRALYGYWHGVDNEARLFLFYVSGLYNTLPLKQARAEMDILRSQVGADHYLIRTIEKENDWLTK